MTTHLFIQDIRAYLLWKQIKSSKPTEQLSLEKSNIVKFCSHSNVFKILKKTFGLVIKLSNSIQQFHHLYILLKTNHTISLSLDDSAKLKEAPSKDIPMTFSTLYYMVWTQQSIFRCRHRACVFLKTKSVSNSSCFKKFFLL